MVELTMRSLINAIIEHKKYLTPKDYDGLLMRCYEIESKLNEANKDKRKDIGE